MADAFEQEIYQRTFVEAEEPSINGTATPGSQGQGTAKHAGAHELLLTIHYYASFAHFH